MPGEGACAARGPRNASHRRCRAWACKLPCRACCKPVPLAHVLHSTPPHVAHYECHPHVCVHQALVSTIHTFVAELRAGGPATVSGTAKAAAAAPSATVAASSRTKLTSARPEEVQAGASDADVSACCLVRKTDGGFR